MHDWKAHVRERLNHLGLDPTAEADVVEELSQHLADRHRDLTARGLSADDALPQALRELDNHEALGRAIRLRKFAPLEPVHDTSRSGWRGIPDDVTYAWRRLRHSPGFAVAAVLTVVLTVGANTAILSVADAVLFRPLPYTDGEQVAIIQMKSRADGRQFTMTPYAVLNAVNDGCPDVGEVGLAEGGPRLTVDSPQGPVSVNTAIASPNYFRILGARPAYGRVFDEHDAGGAGRTVLLSYSAWRQRFGGDPSVIGRTITLGTQSFDVVGVLPAGFYFPSLFLGRPDLIVVGKPLELGGKGGTFHAIVRIAPGVSFERAQSEVEAAVQPLPDSAKQYPYLNPVRAVLYPIGRPVMRYLVAAGVLIFLLGCANLANMLLVRGRRRLRETAVRLAIGASRTRLVRTILFEALFISVAGAVLAAVAMSLTSDLLLKQVPPAAYGNAPVGVDPRVVVITFAMALIGAVVFSVVPAWRASRVDVLSLLQRRGRINRRRSWFGQPLVSVQVAVAVAMVFGAAVAGRSFLSMLAMPLGFSSERVLRIGLAAPPAEPATAFFRRVMDELGRRPDVESVGAVSKLPFSRSAPNEGAMIEGGKQMVAGIVYALPGYFGTLGIPILSGRAPDWADAQGDDTVAVVSSLAARAMFGNEDPLGRTFSNGRDRRFRVVGVVGDVWESFSRKPEPQAYVLPAAKPGGFSLVVRVRDRRARTVDDFKASLRAVAARPVEWFDNLIKDDPAYSDPRFQTQVFVALATLALALTTLGVFSVVAYLASARVRELGVRLAIGASPGSLVSLMLRQSIQPVAAGVVAGLALAYWGGRMAEAQFFKMDASDPRLLLVALALVVIASLVAAYIPARRAARVNPTEVLRSE